MGVLQRIRDWWQVHRPPTSWHKQVPEYSQEDLKDIANRPELIEDPVLGTIYDNGPGLWYTDDFEFLPDLPVVNLSVPGRAQGTTDHARSTVADLRARYAELKPYLLDELYRAQSLDPSDREFHDWGKQVQLVSIGIGDPGSPIDLELVFHVPAAGRMHGHDWIIQLHEWHVIHANYAG